MNEAIRRCAALTALIAGLVFGGSAHAQATNESGRDLAERLCARCHAIGESERSLLAGAPPFRHLEPRVDLDEMQENLEKGLLAGHPDMPVFKLTPAEARALVLYLKAIRAP